MTGVQTCALPILGAGLVQVEKPPEAMSLRADVGDLQNTLTEQLLLEIDVVVLHVRRFYVAIKCEDVALQAGAARSPVNWGLVGDCRYRARGDDLVLAGSDRIVGRSRIEIGRVREVAHDHILGEGIEEDSVAHTDYRFAFAGHIPGDADARREILMIGIV